MKKKVDILAIVKETPLAEAIKSMQTGKFHPPPYEAVGENETIIGELTDAEKAIWTASKQLGKKALTIAESNNAMVDLANRNGQKVDRLKVQLKMAEFEATDLLCNGFIKTFWQSIKKRLGAPAIDSDAIGLREGYKIVSFQHKVDEDIEGLTELLLESLHTLAQRA